VTYLFKLQLKCGCAWRVVQGEEHKELQRRIEHGKYKQCEWEFIESVPNYCSIKSSIMDILQRDIKCYQEHKK